VNDENPEARGLLSYRQAAESELLMGENVIRVS